MLPFSGNTIFTLPEGIFSAWLKIEQAESAVQHLLLLKRGQKVGRFMVMYRTTIIPRPPIFSHSISLFTIPIPFLPLHLLISVLLLYGISHHCFTAIIPIGVKSISR
jgi:hypothetical protein